MGVEMKTKSTQQRRAKGTGSLFLKRGRFIYKHRDPALGRIVYKTLYDDNGSPVADRKTAERIIEDMEREDRSLSRIERKIEYITQVAEYKKIITRCRVCIGDISTAYEQHPAHTAGQMPHKVAAMKFIQQCFPKDKLLADLSQEDAQVCMNAYWKTGVSPKSYNARLQILKMIFRMFLGDDSPFENLKAKSFYMESREPFTIPQLERIWQTLTSDDFHQLHKEEMKCLYLLALYTGARCGDLCLLRKRSVDMQSRIINFTPSKTIHSSGAKVQIPIAEALYIALLPFVNDDAETSPYVLPHVAERYTRNPAGIAKDPKRLLEAAGLHTVEQSYDPHRLLPVIRYSFHSFRHTFSTLAANRGVSIRTVQELLGHSSEKMTAHYTHIGLQTKVQAIEVLPDLVSVKHSPQDRSLAELISGLPASKLFRLGAWLDEHLTETQREELRQRIDNFSINTI